MTKYILVGGYLHKALDGGKSFCEELANGIDRNPIRVLDCLFARQEEIWPEKFKNDRNFFLRNSEKFELELALPDKFLEQVKRSDVIFFQGGETRTLLSVLSGIKDWLKYIEGKVIVGSSAGAEIISKYYSVGETMNIGEGLGLLPIKVIPHWKSESDYDPEGRINWDDLFDKLQSYKENLKIVTLKEGEFLAVEK